MVGWLPFGVPTGCRWCRVQGLVRSSGGALPAFWSLCCFVPDVLRLNMALFRVLRGFLAWFEVVVWVCIARVLCVDCGAFCAREVFGGFMACGVFAFLFAFLTCFYLVSCFLCLSSACPFSLWVVLIVSFSLTDYMQKRKGAKVCPLRPLLSCCVCSDSCTVIEKLPRCVFGFFQFVRLIMPTNTASV